MTRGLTWTGETKRGGAAEGDASESGPETAPSPAAGVGRAMVGVGAGVRVEVGAAAAAAGAWAVELVAPGDGCIPGADGCVAAELGPEPGRTRKTSADTSTRTPNAAVVTISKGRREDLRFEGADS